MPERSTLARNIDAIAKRKGLSLRAIARMTGLTGTTISSIVNRGASPRAKNVAAIAEALGVSVDDLYNPSLEVRAPVEGAVRGFPIPVLTLDQVAAVVANAEMQAEIRPREWVPENAFTSGSGKSVIAVYAENSALDPSISTGDLLYVEGVPFSNKEEKPEAPEGSYVIALAKGAEHPVIRTFIKGDMGDGWLVAENPHFPGESKLRLEKILGVVVAKSVNLAP